MDDITQSDNSSGTVSTTGNDETGDYTATAVGADTVVTTEDGFTQTNTNSSTLVNIGNDYTGDYTTTGTENLGTTIDESYSSSGYDSSSSYSLRETSSDDPDITLTGNNIDGTQDTTQTGDVTYSVHEELSGMSGTMAYGYTLDESGDKDYTLTGSDDANTGDHSSVETGTDNYTLSESNITGDSEDPAIVFVTVVHNVSNISVSGSEDYTIDTSANSQSGDFSEHFTGGGDYDRTESGNEIVHVSSPSSTTTESFSTEDSGSTDFNDEQVGDTRDGGVGLGQSGTDRYSLLYDFDNSSDGASSGFGIVDYSPVGLPIIVTRMSVPAGIFSSIGDDRYDYCFAAGTRVLMADGSRKPIEKIEAGDMVLSVNENSPDSRPEAKPVVEVYRNAPNELLRLQLGGPSDNNVIRPTANHLFYVPGRGWTRADALNVGEVLRSPEGAAVPVMAIARDRSEPTFNLQVASHHTYFVAGAEGSAAVLVHNDSTPGAVGLVGGGTAVGLAPETVGASAVVYGIFVASEAIITESNAELAAKYAHTSATTAEMDAAEADRIAAIKAQSEPVTPMMVGEPYSYDPTLSASQAAPANELQQGSARHQKYAADNAAYYAAEKAAATAAASPGAPVPAGVNPNGSSGAGPATAAAAAPATAADGAGANPPAPPVATGGAEPTSRPAHGGEAHDKAINDYLDGLPEDAVNVLKNKGQVSARGKVFGNVRPDAQWTDSDGVRHYYEVSSKTSAADPGRLRANDPDGIIEVLNLDTGKTVVYHPGDAIP